jgi:hypothetical protein
MSFIPRGNQELRVQRSSPVQIGSTTGARMDGESLQAGARGLQNIGNAFINESRKQKAFEDQNTLIESRAEITSVLKRSEVEAKRIAQADGSDLIDRYNSLSQPALAETLNKIKDPKIRAQMESFAKAAGTNLGVGLEIDSLAMREQHNFNRLEGSKNLYADMIRENPNEDLAVLNTANFMADMDSLVTQGILTEQNAQRLAMGARQDFAASYIDGLEKSGQYGKAINFLRANQEEGLFADIDTKTALESGLIDSKEKARLDAAGEKFKSPVLTKGDKVRLSPELTALANSLDPAKKAQKIKQLEGRAKAASEIRISDVNAQLSGFGAIAMSGGEYSREEVNRLRTQVNTLNVPVEAKRRMHDKINTLDAINGQMKTAGNTHRSQWGNLVADLPNVIKDVSKDQAMIDPGMQGIERDFAARGFREQAISQFAVSMDNLAKTIDHNPGGSPFVLGDPEVMEAYIKSRDGDSAATQAYIKTSLKRQAQLGIPNPRALPNEELASIKNTVDMASNAEEKMALLAGLENKYGEFTPGVIQQAAQITKDKKFMEMVPIMQADPMYRKTMLDMQQNRPHIEEMIKKDERLKTKADSADQVITNKMRPVTQALMGTVDDATNTAKANGYRNLLSDHVRASLVRDPNADVKELVEQAYNDVIASNNNVIATGRSMVMIPNKVKVLADDPNNPGKKILTDYHYNPAYMQAALKVYSTPKGFRELNIEIPTDYKTEQLGATPTEPTGNLRLDAVLRDRYGDSDDGIRNRYYRDLSNNHKWINNEDGSGLRLMFVRQDNSMRDVYNKAGEPIEINIKEMVHQNTPKSVLEEKRGVLGRLFGG